MRKFAFAIAILALALTLVFLSRRDLQREALSPRDANRDASEVTETHLASLEDLGSESREELSISIAEASRANEDQSPAPQLSTCTVFGKVTDAGGSPLAGVRARLQAYKTWSTEVTVPSLPSEYPLQGFEQLTGPDGAFRFVAPVPTNTVTWLTLEPSRFHDSHRVTFNSKSARNKPSLTEGERDLGVIQLATTGAIQGRVVATDGTPLAGAKLDVGPDCGTTFSRSARTEVDGSYVLGHAPIGSYCIEAEIEGYLSASIHPVTVEAERDTMQVDFVLEVAPTLKGRVLDDSGRALEGARLWGWPESSGSGAGAKSGPDGRFTVYLPQDEPYSLECKLAGHEKWGGDRNVNFAPGTTDIEVVMNSLPLTRFVVLDSETRRPLEEFGIDILLDNGSLAANPVYTEQRRPLSKRREEGFAEVTARTGSDLYVIAAPGYALATGDVKHDSPEAPLQTVLLRKGARAIGRLLREGQPVEGVTVTMVEGESWIDENTQVTTKTNARGRFELGGMSSGTFRFTATPSQGAPLQLKGLSLTLGEVTDLGDLELPLSSSAIEGRVLLPPGVEPTGLEVALGAWQDKNTALLDSAGRFRFDNLPAGTHKLRLHSRPGVLAPGSSETVTLGVGQTESVTIDARDRGLCAVALQFDFGNLPTEGYKVQLANAADTMEEADLGHCDAEGSVSGSARGWGETIVQLWLPDGRTLEIPDTGLVLEAGEEVAMTVQRQFARLRIILPKGTTLPEETRITLDLENSEDEEAGAIYFFETDRNGFVDSSPWAGGTRTELFIDGLAAGSHHVIFQVTTDEGDAGQVTDRGETDTPGVELVTPYRGEADALLVIGEEAIIELN